MMAWTDKKLSWKFRNIKSAIGSRYESRNRISIQNFPPLMTIFRSSVQNLSRNKWTSTIGIYSLQFSPDRPLKVWASGQGSWLEILTLLVQGSQSSIIFLVRNLQRIIPSYFPHHYAHLLFNTCRKIPNIGVTSLSPSLVVLNYSGLKKARKFYSNQWREIETW